MGSETDTMTDLNTAKHNVGEVLIEIKHALNNTEQINTDDLITVIHDYNETVEAHQKAIPLTPDKLTVDTPWAFSEIDESEQTDWLMEWWRNLEKTEPMAEHLVEAERELRERRDVPETGTPDFDHLVEDTFREFEETHVNTEAFEAIGAGDVLEYALSTMRTEVSGRAYELWDE